MSKAYGHQYFFAGQGGTCGTMICATCSKPVFEHAHDWLAYKKDKDGDWEFVCQHRKCWTDQSGWQKAESLQRQYTERIRSIDAALLKLCSEFDMTLDDLRLHIEDNE